jgi:hypothetical protein
MLPQATPSTPRRSAAWAVSAVVVVLPLVPVMAMIGVCARTCSRTPARTARFPRPILPRDA